MLKYRSTRSPLVTSRMRGRRRSPRSRCARSLDPCAATSDSIFARLMKARFAFGGLCLPKDLSRTHLRLQDQGVTTQMLGSVMCSNRAHLDHGSTRSWCRAFVALRDVLSSRCTDDLAKPARWGRRALIVKVTTFVLRSEVNLARSSAPTSASSRRASAYRSHFRRLRRRSGARQVVLVGSRQGDRRAVVRGVEEPPVVDLSGLRGVAQCYSTRGPAGGELVAA